MSIEVKEQYERFPYPPVSLLALPKKEDALRLSYERGFSYLKGGSKESHAGKKILIVGAGTFESLVVATAHPKAKEVVALDLSQKSLSQAKKRYWISKILGNDVAKIRFECQDAFEFKENDFDYILLNNVLQHVDNPAQFLFHVSGLLKVGGLMRVVTYPKQSRMWMRLTHRYLKWHGIHMADPFVIQKSKKAIEILPHGHPIRSNFESNSEIKKKESLIDAFFHVCEKPMRPLEIYEVSLNAGLDLIGEDQHEFSRSSFLTGLYPELRSLNAWDCLQILDDALELCVNPIFWFYKKEKNNQKLDFLPIDDPECLSCPLSEIPADPYVEMKQGLMRIQALITPKSLSLEDFYNRLKEEVGSRVMTHRGHLVPLPGLALTDYPLDLILEAKNYFFDQTSLKETQKLKFSDGSGELIEDIAPRQLEWAMLRYGHVRPELSPLEYKESI